MGLLVHAVPEEAPRLQQGRGSAGGARGRNLGLNIQDLRGDARGFSQRFGITHPSVRDAPAVAWPTATGATGIPETFFVDARGVSWAT